ncbi:MAG TPA: heme ABC transporter ATP-binding protein [Rhodoblastus sp.]|nr:heme ABC transporter ATP-binding protein [Rhodoblastus sp.]
MTGVLEARSLVYAIRRQRLVDDVSLSLAPGRLAVVIGPNGAGKSTLLKLLSGELRPQSGDVSFNGERIDRIEPVRLASMRTVMTQNCRLATAFLVDEVVRLSTEFIGRLLTPAQKDEIVDLCLDEAGVRHLAGRDYTTLSGGEQQRARFAACLCQIHVGQRLSRNQAFLLDEPIASLDLDRQLALMDAARALARRDGVAVLAVLHDLNMAVAYADELLVMKEGRIVARGRPEEALTDALLSDVFNVGLRTNEQPLADLPFVLPQHHAMRARNLGQ